VKFAVRSLPSAVWFTVQGCQFGLQFSVHSSATVNFDC
jgi:hypothetical protein